MQDPEGESKQKDNCGGTLRLFAKSLKAIFQTSLGKKKKKNGFESEILPCYARLHVSLSPFHGC